MSVATRSIFYFTASFFLAVAGVSGQGRAADREQLFPSQTGEGNAYIGGEKDFDDMSKAERDAAKAAAKTRKYDTLRVCADPGNMPFSDKDGSGFQNRIAKVLADAMGAQLVYAWRPTFERGLTRQPMNDLNLCDVMVGLPADYEALLTTTPIYRSTYVFATRADRKIHIASLDDPKLRTLRIGVYETSALRNALANHGVKSNIVVQETTHDADLVPEHQPWHQVEQVVKGDLDVAAVWGPFAGWLKAKKHAPIVLQAANLMDDTVPMEFSVGLGVRKYDAVLKYALENAMEAKKAEIAKILREYGIPLVQCSDCLIQGDLPAHGDYIVSQSDDPNGNKPIVRTLEDTKKVEQWLADGADVSDELEDAVLAADLDRVKYLIGKGGDVNRLGKDGGSPLHIAVNNNDPQMIDLLLDSHADINVRDRDGFTPLSLAAAWNRLDAIKVLVQRGADLDATIPGGYTPLFVAVGGGKFAAAKALIEAGAKTGGAQGPQHLTLLMAIATQKQAERRIFQVASQVGPTEIAQDLIARGGDVNAVTTKGVTALMIAAAHDNAPIIGLLAQADARMDLKSVEGQTALDIARQNGNDSAVRALQLFKKTN